MFGNIGMPELLIIFLVVLLLFGAKRIPDIASGLGKGIRDFKRAMKDTEDEIKKEAPKDKLEDKSHG
jgi:sec-independent protein translocase protein TatA